MKELNDSFSEKKISLRYYLLVIVIYSSILLLACSANYLYLVNTALAIIVFVLLQVLLLFFPIYICLKNKIKFRDFNIIKSIKGFPLVAIIIICVLAFGMNFCASYIDTFLESFFKFDNPITLSFSLSPIEQNIIQLFNCIFMITAPVSEELLCRGFLLKCSSTNKNTYSFILMTTFSVFLFNFLHFNLFNLSIISGGIVLILIYLATKNILSNLLVHAAINVPIASLGFLASIRNLISLLINPKNSQENADSTAINNPNGSFQYGYLIAYLILISVILLFIILVFIYNKKKYGSLCDDIRKKCIIEKESKFQSSQILSTSFLLIILFSLIGLGIFLFN